MRSFSSGEWFLTVLINKSMYLRMFGYVPFYLLFGNYIVYLGVKLVNKFSHFADAITMIVMTVERSQVYV